MDLNKVIDVDLLRKVVEELVIDVDIGMYPKSVTGGISPYEKRDTYKTAWNKAAIEYYNELVKVLKKYDIQIKEM